MSVRCLECDHNWVVESLHDMVNHAGYRLQGRCLRCDHQRTTTVAYSFLLTLVSMGQRHLDRLLLDSDAPK